MTRWLAMFLLAFAHGAAVPPNEPAVAESEPRQMGLVETAETRLAQIDVTVTGAPDIVASLNPDDFSIRINWKKLQSFQLDRLCGSAIEDPAATTVSAPARTPSYLLYFDQPHLTLEGRHRALEVARELLSQLVQNGARAMIVSNASELKVIEPFSSSQPTLVAALDRLERDRTQWDTFATEEDTRVARVVELLNAEDDVSRAVSAARAFQREERWLTEKNLRRLALTLDRLADLDPPKAVLYFADTMRLNAGEHYLSFFGQRLQQDETALQHMVLDSFAAGSALDRVINEAAAQGLRVYPVQAEGLIAAADRVLPGARAVSLTGVQTASSHVRNRDAQTTLSNLAAETGGQAFLNGAPAGKIARKLLEDFSCLYVISFDPSDFPADAPLRVVVKLRGKDARLHARGRLFLQSPAARLSSRLLSAFALAEPDTAEAGVRASLVPIGFENGAYSALLQVSVPGTALAGAVWDLGASVVLDDQVRGETSGRLIVQLAGVPAILERRVELAPGAYEIVAVAHEARSGFIVSDRVRLAWPDPDRRPISVGPISLLQPTAGAFLRDGASRASGSLVHGTHEPILTSLPTALVVLVCHGGSRHGPLGIERSLLGDSRVDFPLLELDFENERCAQLRDLVPADTVGPGSYRYVVRILDRGAPAAESSLEFRAVASRS